MIRINYVDCNGVRHAVDAEMGSTLMENAVKNSISGIDAECGGACACATCHIYVDDDWLDKVEAISSMEQDTLDFAYDVRRNSRLACQVMVTDRLDGILVTVAQRQT
jgi:2Fe-2S ferredoxin